MKGQIVCAVAVMIVAGATTTWGQAPRQPPPKPPKKDGFCWRHCSASKVKVYDLAAANYTGDEVGGPRTIRADNLNVLRYSYKFNLTITFSQPPDLWAKLQEVSTPSPAAQPAEPKAAPQAASPLIKAQLRAAAMRLPNVGPEVTKLLDLADKAIDAADQAKDTANTAVQDATLGVTTRTNKDNSDLLKDASDAALAVKKVKDAGQSLVNLLQRSWTGPALQIGYINNELDATSIFMEGIGARWPKPGDISTLRWRAEGWKVELADRKTTFTNGLAAISGALVLAKQNLATVRDDLSSQTGANAGEQDALRNKRDEVIKKIAEVDDEITQLTNAAKLLDWAIGENQRVLAAIPDLEGTSSKYADFRTAQEALVTWQTRMTDLRDRWNAYEATQQGKTEAENPNPFSLSTSADCEFAFSRTKTTAVTLTRVDLMPGTTSTGPETVLSVNVVCTSPFTVSAGVAFSSIDEREFGLQSIAAAPPATGTVNKIVPTAKSSFHPLPLGMIHARLCEFNDTFALHASFGLAGSFRSSSAGGSDAEFLLGPSISLFRTMFLTPGLHLGHKVSVGGGFVEEGEVPSTITTVPIQKSSALGFGFAITFTKP